MPTVSLYEVFKRVLQQRGEGDALQAIALMQQGSVVELTTPIALDAARVSADLGLPMADSIILATARAMTPRSGRRTPTSPASRGAVRGRGSG